MCVGCSWASTGGVSWLLALGKIPFSSNSGTSRTFPLSLLGSRGIPGLGAVLVTQVASPTPWEGHGPGPLAQCLKPPKRKRREKHQSAFGELEERLNFH